MGLVLAIACVIAAVVWWFLVAFADSMSDSPTTRISPWPGPLFLLAAAAVLAFTHFHPIHFSW